MPEAVRVSLIKVDSISALTNVYLSQVGVREKTGNNDGPQVEMYLRSVNLGKGYAWCAAFVHWCLDSAGIRNSITAWSPSAHNAKNVAWNGKEFLKDVRPGDVGCLYYPSLRRIGHTFFYHRTINGSVYETVEGNTNAAGSREGDGVYKKKRSFNATYSITRWE
ncbi:MAG: CHAP domain-containing protein [Chitinophagaceae bacterium]|nr:CHAP domain-containing protein [Chitinophagaceae bacterium]